MTMNAERAAIMKLYGPKFKARLDKMSDSQVFAIYVRLKQNGKIK